jgi:hypothetical protein
MKTVYVVTQGDYSEYGIRAIFSERDEAEKYANMLTRASDEEASVEDWPLDSISVVKGYVWSVELSGMDAPRVALSSSQETLSDTWCRKNLKGMEYVFAYVRAKDAEHALKIVLDWDAERKAKEAGI